MAAPTSIPSAGPLQKGITAVLNLQKESCFIKELRVVGYRADDKDYRVATNRHDLSAEDVAQVYKLRWNIETFFGWWKRHLKRYHLIARSPYGLMVQLLGGLITLKQGIIAKKPKLALCYPVPNHHPEGLNGILRSQALVF